MLEGCGEKGPLLHCWWECKLVQPLWRTIWGFLNKTKNRVATWSSNHTPEKTIIQKDTCTPTFIAALFTIAKTWTLSKCPSRGPSRWQRSKTWRTLSSPQIHQKYIYMWNNSYRIPTERWQKTSDFPKEKKLPTYLGRAKEKKIKETKE